MNLENSAILTECGRFVGEKWVHLNELLQKFDPYLELHWIPPEHRKTDDKHPYRIIHNPPPTSNMRPYVVMFAAESDSPELLFARVIAGDNWHNDVQARMDAQIAAQRLFMKQKHLEELRESADLVHFLLKRAPNYTVINDPRTGERIKLDPHRFRMDTSVARRKKR